MHVTPESSLSHTSGPTRVRRPYARTTVVAPKTVSPAQDTSPGPLAARTNPLPQSRLHVAGFGGGRHVRSPMSQRAVPAERTHPMFDVGVTNAVIDRSGVGAVGVVVDAVDVGTAETGGIVESVVLPDCSETALDVVACGLVALRPPEHPESTRATATSGMATGRTLLRFSWRPQAARAAGRRVRTNRPQRLMGAALAEFARRGRVSPARGRGSLS